MFFTKLKFCRMAEEYNAAQAGGFIPGIACRERKIPAKKYPGGGEKQPHRAEGQKTGSPRKEKRK
jgi:hypothetical protein